MTESARIASTDYPTYQAAPSSKTAAAGSSDGGRIALALVGSCWVFALLLILTHRIYVTNDSVSNYIHVWYVADRFWHGHGIPLHMPVLGHGDAYAFPYGFLPWITAALVRPVLGDWSVTLWLVAGVTGLLAAQWWAFPELRAAWWVALLLINPMLIEAPLLGQLPFVWAAAMLFAAIAFWRRDRPALAAVLLGLSQATHPAVMVPIAAGLVVLRMWWEPRRRRLLLAYAASLIIASPAVVLVVASPTVGDSSPAALAGNFFGTVSLRAIVIAAPFIALIVQRTPLARVPAAVLVALVALNVVLIPIRHNQYAWGSFTRSADASLSDFIDSPHFEEGATYRILRVGDGKIGMYQLVRAGARLDSEPFPEGIDRRSWRDSGDYVDFLKKRRVDYVIIYNAYDRRYDTNEHRLLDQLTQNRCRHPIARRILHAPEYEVYQIDTEQCGVPPPAFSGPGQKT
jgi:hypothetical protein